MKTIFCVVIGFIVILFFLALFILLLFTGLIIYEDHFVADDTIKYEIVHTAKQRDFFGNEHTIIYREPNKTKLYIALAEYIDLLLFSDEIVEMRRVNPENKNVTD